MDPVTQITLGAAVGELLLGKRVGNKAPLWGGIIAGLPDLDMLAYPFVSEIQKLIIHRGLSHSLLLVVVGAPVLGWIIGRIHPRVDAAWRDWGWLAFWALLTHILLDCFTTYGTQIFQPFSDYRVTFSSIFIIDPLYTLPLLAGLAASLFLHRTSKRRRIANYLGLGLSSLYLLFTLVNKWHVESVFHASLQEQGYRYERLLTYPSAFNNLLWIGLADDGEGIWVGHYSILDEDGCIAFQRVDKNRDLIADIREQPIIDRLIWFSSGYYTIDRQNDALYFHDLHLPRTDSWLTERGDHVFSFQLLQDPDEPSRVLDIRKLEAQVDLSREFLALFADRILGMTSQTACRE